MSDFGLAPRQHREPDAHEQEHDVDPLDHADALEEESDWISWHAADHEPDPLDVDPADPPESDAERRTREVEQ